jgi:hypothetical protein
MYDPPGYVWAITLAGITAIPVATCVVLYGGAVRAGLGRRRAALLAGGAAVVLGGWFTASAVIAGHGWYHARLGHGMPWMPVAVVGSLGTLLALRRIPVVARALTAPGTVSRLELPHSFRAAGGVAFLITMALGHLPALFAQARGLAQGGGRRAVRPARGPGRHRRRHRCAAGRPQARAGRGPPRRPVVQRIRPHRPGRGPDPRRPHRLPADQRHPARGADQRAPARADPDSRRAAAVRLAHHVCVRAAKGPAHPAASRRPARGRRDAAYRCGGKPGIPCPMKYATRRTRQCKHDQPQFVAGLLAAVTSTQSRR